MSTSAGAPFLFNDLNINRLALTIAVGFDSKGDLLPDAEMAPVIRQRGVVNVYIGTKRTFGKTETFLDIPMHDDSSGSIHAVTSGANHHLLRPLRRPLAQFFLHLLQAAPIKCAAA